VALASPTVWFIGRRRRRRREQRDAPGFGVVDPSTQARG